MNKISAFVDGSSNYDTRKVGGGVILYNPTDNKIIDTLYVKVPIEYIEFNNVAGELYATVTAIQYAIKNHYSKLDIYYDYAGIEAWANKSWKAKNELTKKYQNYIDKINKYISIEFHKVKAHQKKADRTFENEMNELADKAAKKSLEME